MLPELQRQSLSRPLSPRGPSPYPGQPRAPVKPARAGSGAPAGMSGVVGVAKRQEPRPKPRLLKAGRTRTNDLARIPRLAYPVLDGRALPTELPRPHPTPQPAAPGRSQALWGFAVGTALETTGAAKGRDRRGRHPARGGRERQPSPTRQSGGGHSPQVAALMSVMRRPPGRPDPQLRTRPGCSRCRRCGSAPSSSPAAGSRGARPSA